MPKDMNQITRAVTVLPEVSETNNSITQQLGKRKRKPNSLFRPEEGYCFPSLDRGETSEEKELTETSVPKQQVPRQFGEEMIGQVIMVRRPLVQKYDQGTVRSFDPAERKHLVVYDEDIDDEILDLSSERWILVDGKKLYEHVPGYAEDTD